MLRYQVPLIFFLVFWKSGTVFPFLFISKQSHTIINFYLVCSSLLYIIVMIFGLTFSIITHHVLHELLNSNAFCNYMYPIFVNFNNCVRILATQILPYMHRCSENKKGKTEKWANRVTREGYIREERLCRLFCHSAISFVHRYEMVGVFLSLSRKTVRDHYVYDVYEISIWDLKTIHT